MFNGEPLVVRLDWYYPVFSTEEDDDDDDDDEEEGGDTEDTEEEKEVDFPNQGA